MKSVSVIEKQNFIRLGNYIKKARCDNQISLRQLSAVTKVHYKTIHNIETAKMKKIDPNTLIRISTFLKLDLIRMLILAGYFELVFRLKYDDKEEK